jgi:tetratricopeptide (TPR) repeat protein
VVTYDRDRFSLHPLDQRYAYRQIPDVDGDYGKAALHARAAAFFRQLRKPRAAWKTIDDLEPQLREFHHLVSAGRYDDACSLLKEIDFDYLFLWGYSALIVELRSRLIDRLTDRKLQQANWGILGNAYFTLGEVRQAIASYEQALALARETGDRQSEGRWLGNLGNAYFTLGEVRQALAYHEQALAIAREIGDRRGEGAWLGNLGLAYADLGEVRQAIASYEQALAIAHEIGDRQREGLCLGNLGAAYVALGEVRQALASYEQALALAREIGAKEVQSEALLGLSTAHYHLGNLADARRSYEEALALDILSTNYSSAVKLGMLCLEERKVEEARDYLTRGITLCRALLEKTSNLYNVLYTLALAQLGSGQPDEALVTYRQALQACSARGVVQRALQDLRMLQRAAPATQSLQAATDLLQAAIEWDREGDLGSIARLVEEK